MIELLLQGFMTFRCDDVGAQRLSPQCIRSRRQGAHRVTELSEKRVAPTCRSRARDQALASDAGQLADDFGGIFGRGGRDDGQVEAVVAVLIELITGIGELNEEGAGLALAAGETVEIAQKRGLMLTAEQDARGTGGLILGQGGQTDTGTWATHGVSLRLAEPAGQRWEASPNQRFSGISDDPPGASPAPRK